MTDLRLFISDSYDPWFNLAVEETIFNQMQPNQRVLFLWRNDNTVVIGRAQNPWKECNTQKMEADHIKLARRSSGGGAVFHDLGNTNFTFMAPKPEYDKSISTGIMLNALSSLGVKAYSSGRNDLVIQTDEGEKKISGSAYKERMDRGFHHGTLLLDANLSRLNDYLNPNPKKLQAKGITSVRSRVMNLSELNPDINHQRICDATIQAFFDHYQQQTVIERISPTERPDLPHFDEVFAKQSSWDWNFGHSPTFTHHLDERFQWGCADLYLNIENGTITEANVYTDSLQPAPLEALSERLLNATYHPDTIASIISALSEQFPTQKNELTELGDWFVKAIQ